MNGPSKTLVSPILALALFAPTALAQDGIPLDGIAAIVNDDVVLRSELDRRTRTIRESFAQQGQPQPPDRILLPQVLDRLILERLQLQRAEEMGISVSEDLLNQYINNIARNNNMSLEQFADALRADGIDFAQMRSDIRDEIVMQQVRQREVMGRIYITQREVDTFLASSEAQTLDSREFRLSHILLRVDNEASPAEVERVRLLAESLLARARDGEDFARLAVEYSQGQQALEGGDLGWRRSTQLPAVFAERVVGMEPGTVAEAIRTPGAIHLIKLAGIRGEQDQVLSEQTHVRHIMLRTGPHFSDRRAEERLREVHEQLVGGADFADLARRYSEDQLSAIDGGNLGWVEPGETDGVFERMMADLDPGQFSEPFQSQFGWHIVQVLDRRQHDATRERRVALARQVLSQRRSEEQMESWLQFLRDDAYIEIRLDS